MLDTGENTYLCENLGVKKGRRAIAQTYFRELTDGNSHAGGKHPVQCITPTFVGLLCFVVH